MRLFIAINLPDDLKKSISHFVDRTRIDNDFVRWIPPENIHLTLKFLGEVAPSLLGEVEGVIEGTTSRYSPIDLTMEGAGAFPNLRKPRVVWLGIRCPEVLREIHAELNQDLERFGFERESRPFRPHLTVGRIRSNRGNKRAKPRSLEDRLCGIDIETVTFRVDSIELMESFLEPTGAIYRMKLSSPLKK